MLRNIHSIIFDLDGTLVDSMWVWDEIDIEFLSKRGLSLPPTYQKEIEGMSFTETAIYTKELFQLPESVEELKGIWNQMALDKYAKEVPLKSGVKRFLNYCKENKISMGIATSNSKELVEVVEKAHALSDYIQVIVTSCEVAKGKPAPDVYLEVARRLHTDPEHCLVFEDVPMGILAGKNAGMKVCAVKDAFSEDQQREKKELADYYISSYEDILQHSYEVLEHE